MIRSRLTSHQTQASLWSPEGRDPFGLTASLIFVVDRPSAIPRAGGKCCILVSKLLGIHRNRVESASKQLFGY